MTRQHNLFGLLRRPTC